MEWTLDTYDSITNSFDIHCTRTSFERMEKKKEWKHFYVIKHCERVFYLFFPFPFSLLVWLYSIFSFIFLLFQFHTNETRVEKEREKWRKKLWIMFNLFQLRIGNPSVRHLRAAFFLHFQMRVGTYISNQNSKGTW